MTKDLGRPLNPPALPERSYHDLERRSHGYRRSTEDHTHESSGKEGGKLDHGLALTGLTDDDHTQYIKHSLATAANDMLMASGVGAFVKKTLVEVKTALGIAADIAAHAALTATHGVAGTIAGLADIASAIATHTAISSAHHTKYTDAEAKAAAVSDEVYGAGWDGVTDIAPSKNAVYDKLAELEARIEALEGE